MPTPDPRRPSGPEAVPVTADDVKPYGRYLLFRKLAEGGMAEIFLAKQLGVQGFEKNVVIKRMLQHLSDSNDFVGMFMDEAKIAARLSHPNITQINDFGLVDGRYFICMEYLAGEDFSTVLRTASRRREYVPINVAVRVLIDAAQGLHFAHTFTDERGAPLNIVHRDISPSNIYVTYTGQVKVLDFGIAKATARDTRTNAGVVKGKYMYMSPEQAAGKEVDRRADVFSLGVSLFEALTNTRPFAKDTDLAILNAVLKGDFQHPRTLRPDLPSELEGIVLKAMALHVEDRYQSAAEFAGDLERFLGSSTSASGGVQVAAYLKNLFGDERVSQKTTRIPSLSSLQAISPSMLGQPTSTEHPSKTEAATRAVAFTPIDTESKTRAVVTNPGRQSARMGFVLGVVFAGIALLGGGAGLVWYQGQQQKKNQVEQPAVVPIAKVDPTPQVVTPPVQTPPVVAKIDEPKKNPDPVETPPPEPQKKVAQAEPRGQLTPVEIQKVVRAKNGSMQKCFAANKGDLGSDEGTAQVQFTILGSGAVTNVAVQGALGEQKAGQCLRTEIANLHFRKNSDKEVTLTLPFKWRVER